jgi:hypothetical protein
MGRFAGKINKLCIALSKRGRIYLIDRRQQYSQKLDKPVTIIILNRLYPIAEYNKLFPMNKKDPEKQKFVKKPVLDSFKEINILLALVAIYKEGDDSA